MNDVLRAVNDLFEENKTLDHEFALNEFKTEFWNDFQEERKKGMN